MKNIYEIAEYHICERNIGSFEVFGVVNGIINDIDGPVPLRKNHYNGNGLLELTSNTLQGKFTGNNASYRIRLNLPEDISKKNGLTVCFSVNEWENIRYIAIGHTANGQYRHIKMLNIAQDEWVIVNLGYSDISFGLQNNWQKLDPTFINDIIIYVSGTPGVNSLILLKWASRWLEKETMDLKRCLPSHKGFKFLNILEGHFKNYYNGIEEQAKCYIETGSIPISDKVMLSWPVNSKTPIDITSYNYNVIWNSMRLASSLMVYGIKNKKIEAIFAARELINEWLNDSFYTSDQQHNTEKKFTWDDRNIADRVISLVFMHQIGLEYNFDIRFMSRLLIAIVKQAQLLESEAFYSYHQKMRYNIYALFQDISLIVVATSMRGTRVGDRWLEIANRRLRDQFLNSIIYDNGYATILIKNNPGSSLDIVHLIHIVRNLSQISAVVRVSTPPIVSGSVAASSAVVHAPEGEVPVVRAPVIESIAAAPNQNTNVVKILQNLHFRVKFNHLDKSITMDHFNANDHIFKHYLKGYFYEDKLLEKIQSLNLVGTYVDVGSNIGNHSIYFLNFTNCLSVVSIEGHPKTFGLLKKNIENNKTHKPYILFDHLIGDNNNDEVFIDYTDMNNIGTASIVDCNKGFKKKLHTLDSLQVKDVSLIKIDVEGYEYNVLKGAINTIIEYKPVIFIELDKGNAHYNEIISLLMDLKYETDYINYANTPTFMFRILHQ